MSSPTSRSPLYIPMKKHCFAGHSYFAFAKLLFEDAFVPKWWEGTRRSKRNYNYLFDLHEWDSLALRRMHPGRYPHRRVLFLLDWSGYLIAFPIRTFVLLGRLVVKPILYPSFYLFYREFIHYPCNRTLLRRLEDEGVEAKANILRSHDLSEIPAVVFDTTQPSVRMLLQSMSQACKYPIDANAVYTGEYAFYNDRSEVNQLLGKDFDDLRIGESHTVTLLPFLVEIWTKHSYLAKKASTPAFAWRDFGLSVAMGIFYYNLAAITLVFLPLYCVSIPEGANLERTFWDRYWSVPWWTSFSVLVWLYFMSCRPLSYWERRFLAFLHIIEKEDAS